MRERVKRFFVDFAKAVKNLEAAIDSAIDVWIKMLEDRNYLVHTYTFEESRKIFEHIKDLYLSEFKHPYKIVGQSGIR